MEEMEGEWFDYLFDLLVGNLFAQQRLFYNVEDVLIFWSFAFSHLLLE